MEPLAAYLKSAREKSQASLEQIAADTRISLRHLQNLEAGLWGDLPGGVYNRAFLRSYCEYVGIDPAEALARYDAESAPPKEKTSKAKPGIPQVGPAFKPHPLLVWSVMLLVSVTGLYFSRRWIAAVFSPYFSHPAAPMLPVAFSEVSHASIPAPEAHPAAPAPVSPQAGYLPSSLPGDIPVSAPLPRGTIRLEFEVLQECWVSINRDGRRLFVKLMKPGDEQSFDASDRFLLILGNAGGVRLKINGKPARPLGKCGEVVRVFIDEQNLNDLLEKTSG